MVERRHFLADRSGKSVSRPLSRLGARANGAGDSIKEPVTFFHAKALALSN
jgi:hypothetical protein